MQTPMQMPTCEISSSFPRANSKLRRSTWSCGVWASSWWMVMIYRGTYTATTVTPARHWIRYCQKRYKTEKYKLSLEHRVSCSNIGCFEKHHSASFRSSSKSRTTRRVSFYKRLDGQTSTRCSRRCTGCLLNSASTTSWPCWRSRLSRRHLRSIWISTSRCAPVHATLDRRPSHCCACHFDRHHLPDHRSALPHLWLGTHCHLPY